MSEPNVPPPPPAPPAASGDKTLMLVLSYVGLFALIPLLTEKDDANLQWHAKHGLVLFFVMVIANFAVWIIGAMMPSGCFVAPLAGLVWIAYLIAMVVGIVKATKGERLLIPGVSDFANKF